MKKCMLASACCWVILLSPAVRAKTTSTVATGDWNSAIWDNGAPAAGDTVNVGHSVVLTNATPPLLVFSQTAGTFTFAGSNAWLVAETVLIGGTVTHDLNSDTNGSDGWQVDNRVLITCTNLTLNGSINVSARGFRENPLNSTAPGLGPGGGMGERGGGHGGYGGGNVTPGYGLPYGNPADPQWPGSSGGNRDNNSGRRGGRGGGLVIIEASGHVLINGSILANGENSPDYTWGGGGGAGGGINIRCGTWASTGGVIRADGGWGSTFLGGSGGGGRIAICVSNSAAQALLPEPRAVISARYGTVSGPTIPPYWFGDYGTIYGNDPSVLPTVMTGCYGYVYGPVGDNWVRTSFALTNCWLRFASNQSARVNGDMVLDGTSLYALKDTSVGGDIHLTNGSSLMFAGNPTNGISPEWGTLVEVTGSVRVTASCVIYLQSEATNGGSVYMCVSNFHLAAGGIVSADESGFAGGNPSGYGPGAGSNSYGGAGYGGTGGRYPTYGGSTYGSATNPIHPGSGGAGSGSSSGKRGGGLIRITARNEMAIHGTMSANGGDTTENNRCAGSGGAIYLCADKFVEAYGTLRAEGGDGTNNCGAGGGGRIARYYRCDGFAGTVSVAGGGVSYPGQSGTVYSAFSSNYTVFTVAGDPARHGSPQPYGYGANGVAWGEIVTNTVNSPADEAGGRRYRCIGWRMTNGVGGSASGTGTVAVLTMDPDTTLFWLWTNEYYLTTLAGPHGSLESDPSGWYTHGGTSSVRAIPDSGYYFSQWRGDYGEDLMLTNPLPITMDRPRSITAVFGATGGQTKVWTAMTGDWMNDSNWTPPGVPAFYDSVIIPSGTVTLAETPRLASLTVTGTGSLSTVSGAKVQLSVARDVVISGNTAQVVIRGGELSAGGDIVLAATSRLYAASAATNSSTPEYGVLVRCRDIVIRTNCWLYPQSDNTNGGSPKFIVRNLVIDAGGGIDANGRGFRGGLAPADPGGPTVGWGYGRGYLSNGGGYGGKGGRASPPYGQTYGSAETPIHPGSGGGGNDGNPWRSGGNGGGLVRVEAGGVIAVNGVVRANGNDGGGDYGTGGGSGGGIYLTCRVIEGSGSLTANGGAGHWAGGGSAGGGGRIAVWRTTDRFSGSAEAARGSTVTSPDAEPGTIYWGDIAPAGTVFCVR